MPRSHKMDAELQGTSEDGFLLSSSPTRSHEKSQKASKKVEAGRPYRRTSLMHASRHAICRQSQARIWCEMICTHDSRPTCPSFQLEEGPGSCCRILRMERRKMSASDLLSTHAQTMCAPLLFGALGVVGLAVRRWPGILCLIFLRARRGRIPTQQEQWRAHCTLVLPCLLPWLHAWVSLQRLQAPSCICALGGIAQRPAIHS